MKYLETGETDMLFNHIDLEILSHDQILQLKELLSPSIFFSVHQKELRARLKKLGLKIKLTQAEGLFTIFSSNPDAIQFHEE